MEGGDEPLAVYGKFAILLNFLYEKKEGGAKDLHLPPLRRSVRPRAVVIAVAAHCQVVVVVGDCLIGKKMCIFLCAQ